MGEKLNDQDLETASGGGILEQRTTRVVTVNYPILKGGRDISTKDVDAVVDLCIANGMIPTFSDLLRNRLREYGNREESMSTFTISVKFRTDGRTQPEITFFV